MLACTKLTRRFGDRVAVEDVSFDVRAGEIFALLGPNGAGKTTTMRMLAGLIAPSSGEVRVEGGNGRDGSGVTASGAGRGAGRLRATIGLLTETPGLWDRLSVSQNLMTYARLHGLPEPARAVAAAMQRFDIAPRAGDLAAQLSKGLRQRVALARALIHEPAIVLLDEPTSGLDPQSARDVRAMILRLRDEGRAVLLSTHNLDEVERIADRVAILRTRLVALDTPDALRARLFGRRVRVQLQGPAERFVTGLQRLGLPDVHSDGATLSIGFGDRADVRAVSHAASPAEGSAVDTPAIVRHLVQQGAGIEAVVPEEATLEDVYVRLLQPSPGAVS